MAAPEQTHPRAHRANHQDGDHEMHDRSASPHRYASPRVSAPPRHSGLHRGSTSHQSISDDDVDMLDDDDSGPDSSDASDLEPLPYREESIYEDPAQKPPSPTDRKLMLSVDWGTETAIVSYCVLEHDEDPTKVPMKRIHSIDRYDKNRTDYMGIGEFVPVSIYYPPRPDDHTKVDPICGFHVRNMLRDADDDIHFHLDRVVSNMKLLLDTSKTMSEARNRIKVKVSNLIKDETVVSEDQIFVDYLSYVLEQAYKYLVETYERIQPNVRPEFVINMPVEWGIPSYNRLLKAFNAAILKTWPNDEGSIPRKFTVAEPIAAAQYILHQQAKSHSVKVGDIVMVGDAGGGTVEFVTFEVTQVEPLRFKSVTDPNARSVGSSLLNSRMLGLAKQKISARHNDLVNPFDIPIDGIAESQVIYPFETSIKAQADLKTEDKFHIAQIRQDLKDRCIKISPEEMTRIFDTSKKGILDLLKEQFAACKTKGIKVHKLIMAGSFSNNEHLLGWVREFKRKHSPDTVIVHDRKAGCAVSQGGLMRALNKDFGPRHNLTMSAGILRHWQKDSIVDPAQRRRLGKATRDTKYTGELFYDNTIEWFASKGKKIEPGQKYAFVSTHDRKIEDDWVCEEVVYFSDKRKFGITNRPDNSTTVAELGRLTIDFKKLKEDMLDRVPKEAHPITNEDVYNIRLMVEITVAEEFFHTLRFRVTWAPWIRENDVDDAALNNNTDPMDTSLVHEKLIDIGSAFELSTN